MGRRIGSEDSWQMPQGGIDPGETPAEAAMRELYEETGVTTAEILVESQNWYRYDLPQAVSGRALRGRYRGQEQRWFLLRFTGLDRDIDLKTHHQEFSAWRWAEPKEILDRIVDFKRPVYEQVFAEFAPHLAELAQR
jgi:putative (di)nucleoside polyphosphate hydrolase